MSISLLAGSVVAEAGECECAVTSCCLVLCCSSCVSCEDSDYAAVKVIVCDCNGCHDIAVSSVDDAECPSVYCLAEVVFDCVGHWTLCPACCYWSVPVVGVIVAMVSVVGSVSVSVVPREVDV